MEDGVSFGAVEEKGRDGGQGLKSGGLQAWWWRGQGAVWLRRGGRVCWEVVRLVLFQGCGGRVVLG